MDGPVLGIEYLKDQIPNYYEKLIYDENIITAYKNIYPNISDLGFQK